MGNDTNIVIDNKNSIIYQCTVCVENGLVGATPCHFSFTKIPGIEYEDIGLRCPVESIQGDAKWTRKEGL